MLVNVWGTRSDPDLVILPEELAVAEAVPASLKPRKRQAVTAMEYLVMISFILVVVILTVQHLGSVASGLFGTSAKATNFSGGGQRFWFRRFFGFRGFWARWLWVWQLEFRFLRQFRFVLWLGWFFARRRFRVLRGFRFIWFWYFGKLWIG